MIGRRNGKPCCPSPEFSMIKYLQERVFEKLSSLRGPAAYWNQHLVPVSDWKTSRDSLSHFHWRNAQYPGYIDLMPVNAGDGLTVLDYGCGPGNDLVGFAEYSNTKRLIGADVSRSALTVAENRLKLHNKTPEFVLIDEKDNSISIESESVDLVHSSGVLHHVLNLGSALAELHRVMKPDAKLQIMVYNYNSVWLHLYVAYMLQIAQRRYANMSVREAFRRTTDGADCPIAHCYTPGAFVDLMSNAGFRGKCIGSSISIFELKRIHHRFDAIQNRALPEEHREFLGNLSFNRFGHPLYEDVVAGIGACFEFTKKGVK